MKKNLSASVLLAGVLCLSYLPAVADSPPAESVVDDVRIIPMHNPAQPFEMAAKLQWNPHDERWDKVLVVYNGAANPPSDHPVWAYLDGLVDPKRPPSKPGENIGYRPFRMNDYCDGTTPLTSGKPMRVSFDQNQLGRYIEKDYFRDWNCPKWGMGLNNLAIVGGKESRNGKDKALRITLLKGLSGCENENSCINWKPEIGAELDGLYYSYWIKFPANFDFVLGGKLPGVGSEKASTGGDRSNGRNGWSVRAMWDRDGKLGQYVYYMDQRIVFGDFMEWDTEPVVKDKWHHIKTYVRLNAPGQKNGMIRTWLDGKEVLNRQDLRFRIGNDLKIERLLFSVFYGGSGPEWAPARNNTVYMDEFVMSVQPQ